MSKEAYERIIRAAEAHVRTTVEEVAEEAVGDSPIEKILYTALVAYVQLGKCEYQDVLTARDKDHLVRLLNYDRNDCSLIVASQQQLDGWRVDFIVFAYDHMGRTRSKPGWRRLIVECDGHDFHERTKEQAARDRERDRRFQEMDFDVFRFTGAEIWRDPWKCAENIVSWALRGFG